MYANFSIIFFILIFPHAFAFQFLSMYKCQYFGLKVFFTGKVVCTSEINKGIRHIS